MEKEETKISVDSTMEFSLRNKQVLQGKFVKEYIHKGIMYYQIQVESGRKYLINPKKAKQI